MLMDNIHVDDAVKYIVSRTQLETSVKLPREILEFKMKISALLQANHFFPYANREVIIKEELC